VEIHRLTGLSNLTTEKPGARIEVDDFSHLAFLSSRISFSLLFRILGIASRKSR
jgi:hypothetical protein